MRVAVRVDAGPSIGGGHAMRCLALADALSAQGAGVAFVSAAMPDRLCERIVDSGHQLFRIAGISDRQHPERHAKEAPLGESVQAADLGATEAVVPAADWMIVDHYLLDARWHSAARSFARNVLVIDDLANRAHDCDLLLDQTFGRNACDYTGLLPTTARVLASPNFALLRPEFKQERAAAIHRRKNQNDIHRILISVGMTDIGETTSRIIDQVLAAAPQCHVDVALGPIAAAQQHAMQLPGQNGRLRLHTGTREMAPLMRDADLAIGAAGTTSYERCCMGLPTILLILAENQRPNAIAFAKAGAAILVDHVEDVGDAVRQLLDQPTRLSEMIAAAFPITDGRGAERVAAQMFCDEAASSGTVEIRPATSADMEQLWLWRNDPVTRAQSRNSGAVSWKSHVRWLTGAFADPARTILIGETDGIPVASVGLHPANGGREVSIVVAPAERGRGVGRAMLNVACANATHDLYAAVQEGNVPSRRLFESCGFAPVESNEPGFIRYLRRSQHRRSKQA